MNVLDIFSGIGGFSLGLERAGFHTVAFCEIEPYCRAVLSKHWPGVPVYDDVRSLTAERLAADGIVVDVICGGFPCQDISLAGKGAGLAGERSGLWREFHRLIAEIRPRYAIIENVSALRSRGLDEVLGSLAALGYDAEWHCIPASAVGAPHRRDRVWIVAHPQYAGRDASRLRGIYGEIASAVDGGQTSAVGGPSADVADSTLNGREPRRPSDAAQEPRGRQSGGSGIGADGLANANQPSAIGGSWWESEPDVGRVAHGVPSRVDRLKSLGNTVVPQIPEIIGRAILSAERAAVERGQ